MSTLDQTRATRPTPTAKAVHSWSLFRTLGRYVALGSMPSGAIEERQEGGLPLLELPAELARHGYTSTQLCHFYLPSLETGYLEELRAAFVEAGVELECFLVDDGDLTHPVEGPAQLEWVSGWLDVAATLAPARARVVAGKQAPDATTLAHSADQLRELARRHPAVRVVTENWHALLPDAASVNELLDRTAGEVGLLVDLGNWKGPGKYAELAAVAARAETCQAKVRTSASGEVDAEDYRACLGVLRDAGYDGPLALVYDGADPDEWNRLEDAAAIVAEVFG
ncbi:sugar phosphate isomerase/epimerase family protein [uncultured Friedmanniella sp.]|uniref:sugar phosphate isomerase/epimerase family protein n=1 Tax=uncultured Friedmanniella sp. TaxID=335381 RepID=UPI0035CAEEB4